MEQAVLPTEKKPADDKIHWLFYLVMGLIPFSMLILHLGPAIEDWSLMALGFETAMLIITLICVSLMAKAYRDRAIKPKQYEEAAS